MDLGLSGDVSSKGVNVAVTGNAEFPHVVNRNAVLRHYMSNGIQDDDELHAFISEGLGYTIPREPFCKDEGHCAPFDFIADLFFERVETAIGFANRTGGKTLNVSIVNFCNSIFKPGCTSTSCGAIKRQADKAYDYFQSFFNQNLVFANMIVKGLKEETILKNGSKLEIVVGTMTGVNSPHPHKSMIDEVELMDWKILQQALSMSMSGRTMGGRNILGQDVFTSTRKFPYGPMQRLLNEAEKRRIRIYKWCIWETLEQCRRKCKGDSVWGDCPAYAKCEGKAHETDGFYPVADFIKKIVQLDTETWETEWLNLRPRRTGLVYQIFNESVHVWSWDKFAAVTKEKHGIPEGWKRYRGFDFGFTNPFVCLWIAEGPDNRLYLYDEYYQKNRIIRDHAHYLKKREQGKRYAASVADASAKGDRMELLQEGDVWTLPSRGGVQESISSVRGLLEIRPDGYPGLVILQDAAPHTVREFNLYHYLNVREGRAPSELPEKIDDHCMDALRYVVETWIRLQKGQKREKSGNVRTSVIG